MQESENKVEDAVVETELEESVQSDAEIVVESDVECVQEEEQDQVVDVAE